ncbi:MAG: hypothetical protein JXA10_07430 [Anaerolineae bacterium]|nr:hypothetical protein [Anaerolineae bacterium]
MQLTPSEVERFYRVWFSLLIYANKRYKVIKKLAEPAEPAKLAIDIHDAIEIRDKVWADDSILDRFVADNPHQLAAEDLALATSWHKRVSSAYFIIFRHLKAYTVFLDDSSPARAYGVLGLKSSFKEICGPNLPVMVQAVLLPFEDKITFDGLLRPYSLIFGGGYRASFNDAYRDAKEREGIITQLGIELSAAEKAEQRSAANQRLLKAFEKYMYQEAGLSPQTVQRHLDVIQVMSGSFLPEHLPEKTLRDIESAHIQHFLNDWLPQHDPKKQKKAHTSLKRFLWFLRDTARVDWDIVQKALDDL